MELFSQPFDGQLGEYLQKYLLSKKYRKLSIVVAFAKNSGVLRLRDTLKQFRDNGGEIHVYLGVDMNGTSYEALMNLLPIVSSLHVVHDTNGQTFHTKLFHLVAPGESMLIVGSHNLTGGGLWTNYESSIQMNLDLSNPAHSRMHKSVEDYLEVLSSLTGISQHIQNEQDIKNLLKNNYVQKEVKSRIEHRRTLNTTNLLHQTALFAATKRAPLPSLPKTHDVTEPSTDTPTKAVLSSLSLVEDYADATLWLETRKMTGGSRNILDLSKTSLLRTGSVKGTSYEHTDSNFMRGAVEFFGVGPDDIDVEKQITVNFEGIDYANNIIKFPKGEHSNGTWRVQIKGISDEGEKITTAFKKKASGSYLLPDKIVAFTRIKHDYYYLSVFDKSDLPEFLETSEITAYNGRTEKAKYLGII